MSEFVNYSKRSVTLPDGFKDLVDVLNFQSSAARHTICKLSDIGGYVSLAWASHSPTMFLWVSPGSNVHSIGPLRFAVERWPETRLRANFQVEMKTEAETALRRFLQLRGFATPDESLPKSFSHALPVAMICDILPLPAGPEALTALAIQMFQEVWRLTDESEMTVIFCEPRHEG